MADWKLRDNYLRVSILLIDGGGFVVKEFVLQKGVIDGGYKTLDAFLAVNKTIIKGLMPRVFKQSQIDILFPIDSATQRPLPTDIKRWDITLTTAILNNCVPVLSQLQTKAFQDIRSLRNELFGHTAAIALSDPEFQTNWKQICTILKSASKLISKTCEDKLDELVNTIETENISANRAAEVEGVLNYIKLGIEDIRTDVEDVHAQLEDIQDNQRKADNKMDEHIKNTTESDPLRKAFEHAKDRLKAHSKDVTTVGTERCSFGKEELAEKLYTDNVVILAGIPGSGKTHLAFSLMDEFINKHPEIKPLIISLPQNIKNVVDPFGSYVLLIDDMIGKFHIDSRELQDWNRYADEFLSQLQSGKLYVTITIRLAILKECETTGEISKLFKEYKYTTLDHSFFDESKRLQILQSYIEYKDIGITPEQIQEIVCIKNTQIGFPLLCRKLEKSLDIINQFETPTNHIKSEILNIVEKNMPSFLALLMTLFCDNMLNKFGSDKQDSCFEIFASYFGQITKPSIYKSADTLESTYLKQPTKGQFAFLHNSIAESLFDVSIQQYPDLILQQCPFKVLINHLNKIDANFVHPLIRRFITELSKPDFETMIFDMARSPYWNNSIFTRQAVKQIDIGYYFKPNNKVRSLFSHFAEFGLSHLVQIIWSTSFKTDKCETQTRNTQMERAICDACICDKRTCVNYLLDKVEIITEEMMFAAAEGGNIDTFKSLADRYGQDKMASLKHSDTGRSLLHVAAFHGRESILRFVSEKCPALINQIDYSATTAGQSAVEKGHKDCLVALTDLGYDVFIQGRRYGETLLHTGAIEGHTHIVEYLCNKFQSMLPLKDENGHTSLHYAAYKGNVSSLKYLIEQGLDPLIKSGFDRNILSISILGGNVSVIQHICDRFPEMLPPTCRNKVETILKDKDSFRDTWTDLLLTEDYFENERTRFGDTILHQVAINSTNSTLHMVKNICEKYPHLLNKKDRESRTAAHRAADGGTVECLKCLIEQGCDQDATTDNNETILHRAAIGGNINVVTYICEKYPYMLNKTDKNASTAAHYAAQGTVECLKHLIEQGCNPDATTVDNETILHRAAVAGNINVVTFICQQYPHLLNRTDNRSRSAAHDAACGGTVDCLKYLIEQGCNPNATSDHNETILHRAAISGTINVVTYICEKYPHMLNKIDDKSGTAAHYAANKGAVECLKHLIEQGCNPDATTDDNETILHRAANGGNINGVTYICQQYPHMLDKKDKESRTALQHANLAGSVECIQFLEEQTRILFRKRPFPKELR